MPRGTVVSHALKMYAFKVLRVLIILKLALHNYTRTHPESMGPRAPNLCGLH